MDNEINAGTPEFVDTDSSVVDVSNEIPEYDLQFPTNEAGERTVRVIRQEPIQDSNDFEPSQETPSESLPKAKPENPWESRYKEVQSSYTKVSQQNAELRDRLTIANRDIQHLMSMFEGRNQQAQNENGGRYSPEEWQELVNSQEKFNGYLTGPFANSLLQTVSQMIEQHSQQNPAIKESAYRSDLDKLIVHSEKEGIDIRALKPELLAVMRANRTMPFIKAYEIAKDLAKENGKKIQLVPSKQASNEEFKEKAKRLGIEQNRASGRVGGIRKVNTGNSRRDNLENSLNEALQEAGLF